MTNPTPTDWRALCAELLGVIDTLYKQSVTTPYSQTIEIDGVRHAIPIGKDILAQDAAYADSMDRARAALAQPELTVQDCADMDKHRMSFIDEDSSGLITLDGCFTREELLELAQTRPAPEQGNKPPSLKEQALQELNLTEDLEGAELSRTQVDLIRRAIEALPE